MERVVFCRKRLAPLEQERIQLETIGMKDELKLNRGTAKKLTDMLEEALQTSDEISDVAQAAKKTRDMHAAAVDRGVVADLDLLLVDIKLGHSQIALAAASASTFPGPSNGTPARSRPSDKGHIAPRASKAPSKKDPGPVGADVDRRARQAAGRNKKASEKSDDTKQISPTSSNPPIAVSVAVNQVTRDAPAQIPRGWGTVGAARSDTGKKGDTEPTPAESSRHK
mmetsp:Transcript_22646/g.36454  ORF Transcript_22646/g.36454 Transcript_22646/m.36454 type:complete len:225 (-) Transcript_22646:119-793(-)